LASARIYQSLNISSSHRWKFPFLSFRRPTKGEFAKLAAAGVVMDAKTTYRVEIARVARQGTPARHDPRVTTVHPVGKTMVFFSGPLTVVQEDSEQPSGWLVRQF
jgi:hypothetical protein